MRKNEKDIKKKSRKKPYQLTHICVIATYLLTVAVAAHGQAKIEGEEVCYKIVYHILPLK